MTMIEVLRTGKLEDWKIGIWISIGEKTTFSVLLDWLMKKKTTTTTTTTATTTTKKKKNDATSELKAPSVWIDCCACTCLSSIDLALSKIFGPPSLAITITILSATDFLLMEMAGSFWLGFVCPGLIRAGLVWFGLVWFGLVWTSLVSFGSSRRRLATIYYTYYSRHPDMVACRADGTMNDDSS
jgi:hypothetical protein